MAIEKYRGGRELSKRALGRLSQGVFTFVSRRQKVAEAVDEVTLLNRQILIGCAGGLVLSMAGLGVWQLMKVRSPWVIVGCNGAAIALVNKGKSACGKLGRAQEMSRIASHADLELQKQREIVARFPELAPIKVRGGIGGDLVIALMNHGIEAHLLGVVMAPSFYRIKLRLEGETIERIQRLSPTLKTSLRASQPPIVSSQIDCVAVDVERPDRQFVGIEKYLIDGFHSLGTPVTLPIGVDIDGRLITAKPLDPNHCHFLIGGTTGSGKSEFLRAWIRWLMQWHPRDVQVIIIDPKRVTFADFEVVSRLKKIVQVSGESESEIIEMFPDLVEAEEFAQQFSAWLPAGIIKDSKEAIEAYGGVEKGMHVRYDLFERWGVSDITQYNKLMLKLGQPPMPVLFIITDEYYIQVAEETNKKLTEKSLKPMGAMARAAGICIVIATQRPEMTVVTPMVRSMLPARVCLKVATTQDSQIVLGRTDDEAAIGAYLLGKGDLIAYLGNGLERMQSLYWDGKSRPGVPEAIEVKAKVIEPAAAVQALEQPVEVPKLEAVPEPGEVVPPIDSVRAQYERYRAWRNEGNAPYKFIEADFGNASAKSVTAFESAMTPYFSEWIRELNTQEYLPDQMVKIIWNLTPADRAGGKKFGGKLKFVNLVLGVKDASDIQPD